jgi:NAD(P)-dependent dehydrogenase (short-subunit alcohol dehydrogenase family)
VTETRLLQAAIDAAAMAHGPVSVLVANAADDTRISADAVTEEGWDHSQNVNLRHYFFAAQKAADSMRAQGHGSIIMFSSITQMMGMAGIAPYVTANAGIVGMTRALAREWGPDGVRVNAIAPGWVLTERQRELWATPQALAEFLPRQSLKAFMEPAEMVGSVLFLASGTSRFMTGQLLVVDGGVVHGG